MVFTNYAIFWTKFAIPVLCLVILALLATILAAVAVAYAVLPVIWPVSIPILASAAAAAAAATGTAADAAASCAWAAVNCVCKAAIYDFKVFSCVVLVVRSAYYLASSLSSFAF